MPPGDQPAQRDLSFSIIHLTSDPFSMSLVRFISRWIYECIIICIVVRLLSSLVRFVERLPETAPASVDDVRQTKLDDDLDDLDKRLLKIHDIRDPVEFLRVLEHSLSEIMEHATASNPTSTCVIFEMT